MSLSAEDILTYDIWNPHPYINLNKSQFEYEYNNIEFFVFIGKGGSKIRELQDESGARINVRLNIKIRLKFV
jgi:hypothetical protein